MSTHVKCHEKVCYLPLVMNKIANYLFRISIVFSVLITLFSCSSDKNKEFSEIAKVSIREIGHKLLLANQDSTSLVLPIKKLEPYKYQLSFEQDLSINPEGLVSIIKNSFQKSGLPQNYRIEVIHCNDNEVAYSYEVKLSQENDIIPCKGRDLPKSCYLINVRFTNMPKTNFIDYKLIYIPLLGILMLTAILLFKRKEKENYRNTDNNYTSIGSFHFYPEQNKLIKASEEISLSRKECELLAIFIAHPNQVIKREELTKKVWEDHGVIVGRSLDTYISKLRNILKEDSSIKISNVHGVGYKLEILK